MTQLDSVFLQIQGQKEEESVALTEQAIFMAFAQTHRNGPMVKAAFSPMGTNYLKGKKGRGTSASFYSSNIWVLFCNKRQMLLDPFLLECTTTTGGIVSPHMTFLPSSTAAAACQEELRLQKLCAFSPKNNRIGRVEIQICNKYVYFSGNLIEGLDVS